MKIRMWDTRHVPTHSLFLEHGHEYDLPEELGHQLIGQGLGEMVAEMGRNIADKIIKPVSRDEEEE